MQISIDYERRGLQRILMNHYIGDRVGAKAARAYEQHLYEGIIRLEEGGRTEEAQSLRQKLPQHTEEISDTGVLKAIRAAMKTGKLSL